MPTAGRMLFVSTAGCCARLSEPRSGRGSAKKQKGLVVPLTSPTNPAHHPAQRFEPQQNPSPMLPAVRGGAHDEQVQETIRQNGAPAARDRADHQTSL